MMLWCMLKTYGASQMYSLACSCYKEEQVPIPQQCKHLKMMILQQHNHHHHRVDHHNHYQHNPHQHPYNEQYCPVTIDSQRFEKRKHNYSNQITYEDIWIKMWWLTLSFIMLSPRMHTALRDCWPPIVKLTIMFNMTVIVIVITEVSSLKVSAAPASIISIISA